MRLWLIIILISFKTNVMGEYLSMQSRFDPNLRWTKFSQTTKLNLRNLFQTLAKSKTGRDLLRRARDKAQEDGKTLYDIVEQGSGSLTDTTLVRKFSVGSLDKISYEVKSKVFINRELRQYDALLDLAHELTHFVFRKNFNPYDKNFSLKDFITNTIEGGGGEVQAFIMECRVQKELFSRKNSYRYNCQKIIDNQTGEISFALAVKHFYQVGPYYESFHAMLLKHGIREHFPKVSSQKVNFVSSAYGIPYPVAAFEEYISVLTKVCENDKKRLGYFKQKEGRSPGSVFEFEKMYKARCKHL